MVRVIKLYRHALRLCSTDNPSDEVSATPLLESIIGSFLLRTHDLPNQLKAVKFATCKLLGGIYMKSKQNKKAMKFLVKAIELDRNDLTLWLRLARVAIRAARFPTATVVLEHILTEHPSHPIALPLALLVYMVTSDFEVCLELASRALKLDPLNERAIYCVQYILGLQPSLSPLVEDILQSSPHILTESISDGTKQQLDDEFLTLRGRFREQLDAQADTRKILTVSFPERLPSLTWTHLMDASIKMFDQLLEESSIRLVLDLLSLLPEETVPVEPDDEHATESSPGITTNPIPMSVDNANEQETDVLACPLYSVELDKSQPLSSHPLSAEISTGSGEGTATSTWGLSEPPEKRRSARVRPDVDLTDGLNRYRSRRGYATTADSRVTVKSPGRVLQTTETKPKPLNRFRCAEQVRGLLPAIVRDLAKIQDEEVLSSRNTPQVVPEAVESHVNLLSLEAPNNRHSSLWSAESVAEFLKILHDTKPNIVTFGIAIILQVSQLHGDNWSAQLCELYISMSERLRCSLPRWFLSPSEYRHLLVTDTSATETASLDKLLPIDVLSLRSPPSLVALTRFNLVYVELRLEQLECVISPSSLPVQLDHQPRDPRNHPNERFLSDATVMTLVDVLTLHEPGSPEFPSAHAHYLWINYLFASIVQDYTEMEGYLSVLKEHLTQYDISVSRNFSVYHGSLSIDHINTLLNQLTGVSEFKRLSQLSNESKHRQILTEITSILEQRRLTRVGSESQYTTQVRCSNSLLQSGTCAHVREADLLSLLESSLEYLLDQWNETNTIEPDASNSFTDHEVPVNTNLSNHELRMCYRATVLLLESILWLSKCRTEADSLIQPICGPVYQSDPIETQLNVRATSAIRLLIKFWDLFIDESPTTVPLRSVMNPANVVGDLTQVSKNPLRFHFPTYEMDDEDNVPTPSVNEISFTSFGPSLGEACRSVCACLEWIATSLESSLLGSTEIRQSLSPQFITTVFEHLVCIEQSIPAALLPQPLREYNEVPSVWLHRIPDELLLSLFSGRSAAPPSLAWLHWSHELLSHNGSKTDASMHCRQRKDLLFLLRQLVWRTARQLKSITSAVHEKASVVALNKSASTESTQTDTLSSPPTPASPTNSLRRIGSDEEFIQPLTTNDDDTVACVEDLIRSNSQPWPIGCVSLNHILAQTLLCLVPSSLFRQLNVSVFGSGDSYSRRVRAYPMCALFDRTDAPGSDDEFVPESGDGVQLHASKRSDSASVCITPLWIQKVNKLLIERQWCSHTGPLPSSHPVWWCLQAHESKTSIPEEIKVLDWQCIQTVFEFCHPTRIPEYDSVKTLSVSNELLNLLQAAIELIPTSEKNRMLTSDQVTQMIQSNAKIVVELPEEPVGLSPLTQIAFYLIADHYMKNNNFELATKYYLEDLRVCPRRSSTWAALGLIYYSDLEQIINLTNLKTERVSPDAVTCCLRCFSVAISLIPWSVTLLIERGCLAYQLHAYAARIVKKSPTRTFPDAHLNLCRKWRTSMLQLTRQCYQHVLAMQEINPASDVQIVAVHESASYVGPSTTDESVHPEDGMKQAKDEEWLCRYMLAKCSEKEAVLAIQGHDTVHGIASYLLPILDQYRQVLQALDAAGAKYPKKVIVYHKLPFRAVEAIEVYYRIHALALKTLLNYGQPDPDTPKLNVDQVPLVELRDFLIALQSSEFVAGCGKPRRGKKRTMTAAGLGAKNVPPKQAVISNGATTSAADVVARPERPHSVEENPEIGTDAPASPVASVDLVTKLTVGDFSSQDEFIDLTSPEPPTPDEDAPIPRDSSDPLLKNPQALWKDCVDRCRVALELVLQRLPLHYKAMYRLADVYLRAPHLRDPMKALSILLGPVDDTYKSAVGGLFKDRKQNNFFHGVWRIPTSDIDRSGNFAAHMFRSVSLTLDTLSECGDWRHLVHIFHQLRKQPPEDKRGFLGEGDRVYLARRAFNLIQPTLLIWLNRLSQPLSGNIQSLLAAVTHSGHKSDPSVALQALSSSDSSQTVSFINVETLTQIYRLHCVSYSRNCLPNISPIRVSKESSPGGGPSDGPSSLAALQISGFADVLQLAYRLCPSAWDSRGPNVDLSSILLRCVDLTSRSSTAGNNSSNRAESGRSTAALARPQ
ncbi:hypothetical protein D915_008014 [Fasciola hepatica]|uniref:Calcineurin-binding protein cabin-1 n=1 Tax=Fasciola hepatica TaxID=6192 RepID=A0A4E0R579_FASHE|nr:hypothetical protein D915_008014 [Fasciola hepatica]